MEGPSLDMKTTAQILKMEVRVNIEFYCNCRHHDYMTGGLGGCKPKKLCLKACRFGV